MRKTVPVDLMLYAIPRRGSACLAVLRTGCDEARRFPDCGPPFATGIPESATEAGLRLRG